MLTQKEIQFATQAIRRKKLFLALSVLGIVVAAILTGHLIWRGSVSPIHSSGLKPLLIVLILLMSRLNLRQSRYAAILEKLKIHNLSP